MSDIFYTHFKRLISSILSQWLLIVIFFIGYYWTNHILSEKIWSFFGLLPSQQVVQLPDQTNDFLKSIASFPDFKTMAAYLSNLLNQAGNWGYVNLTLIFAKITRFVCMGICNIILFYIALNIIVNVFKTYKQQNFLQKSVTMITDALSPELESLTMEIRRLSAEVKMLKNELYNQ